MKKIKYFIVTLMGIFFFFVTNQKVYAESTYEITNLVEIDDHEIKYSRSRTIHFKVDLSAEDYLNPSLQFRVCELDPENPISGPLSSTCLEIPNPVVVGENDVYYMITTIDGHKMLQLVVLNKLNNVPKTISDPVEFILDTQGPIIEISGARNIILPRKGTYKAPTCVATDDNFGLTACTVDTSKVSTNNYGESFEVTFYATDALGNTSVYIQNVSIEDKPAFNMNTKVVISALISAVAIGAAIYIGIWQKKDKEKQKERLLEEKRSFHLNK